MKELLKTPMKPLIILLVLISFNLTPANHAMAVVIVPVKDQNSSLTLPNNIHTKDKETNPKLRENNFSKKEIRKYLKAQDPNLLPEANIEWFFLLGSAVGLFIAIFASSAVATLGWLIFAGGLITYLFYKLLKN